MVRKSQPFLWLLLLMLAMAGAAFSQQTGSISGVVHGADGAPLPGVTVTVSGPLLPAGRTVVTDEGGAFSVLRLTPGDYEVSAELTGMGTAKRPAVVALDKDTQVELEIKPSVAEEITVTAALPTIDVKASDVQSNYTSEQIEDLPVPRTYRGLFQLAPGVSENGHNTPNAGASRMDNMYLVDGINVTNPHYGDILPDITELDIDEASIKRGGITAEYGRAAGMVVNAVTKSGTNDFHGQVRAEYQPSDFVSDSKIATIQNKVDRELLAGSLGGPIARDRFWFYGSVNLPRFTTTDRVNNLGAVPDSDRDTDEYFGKLTANPLPSHFFNLSLRSRDTKTTNSIGASTFANTSPSVATSDSTDYLLGTFDWVWNLTADSLAELKLNHNKEENSSIPITDLGYRPLAFNAARPDLMGAFTTAAGHIVGGATAAGQVVGGGSLFNFQDFKRDEARLIYQRFASLRNTRHDLRAGVTYDKNEEQLTRRANGWGSISFSTTTQLFTANYVSIQPPHTGRAEVWGAFLQDQIALGERTTLMAGVLVNKDEYFGEALGSTPGTKRKVKILTFDWDQQIQPRLGITFVPNVSLGDKLYFNFGRYSNTENKSLTRAASPTRIFTTRATFDVNGNLISEVPAANTQNKKIDPGLDPMYTDEYLAGYARPLGSVWSAEIWGMYREVGDIFEDVSADGLGNGPFHVAQLPDAYRKYTAASIELNRRPVNDRWRHLWINASYTWSRLKGNWDIDYADQLFFNSSILQDGPGVLITDNRSGLLLGDRTHVVKLFATIEPIDRLRTGTYVRYQSGAAWEARAQPATNVTSSYYYYLEPAGSRRMEDWLNVDLLTSYELRFGGVGVEVEARITNLFDEQAELTLDQRWILNQPLIVGNPALSPSLSKPSNNPQFGRPTQLSDPRAYVVSAIVRF